MFLNEKKYQKLFEPSIIYDLLQQEFIKTFLRGFFHSINTGVSLIPAVYDEKTEKWGVGDQRIDAFDLENDDDKGHFNQVCFAYYSGTDKERPECKRCDREALEGALKGEKPEKFSYNCWLGFAEYAYILKIAGKPRALILTGQCFPQNTLPRYIKDKIKDAVRLNFISQNLGQKMTFVAEKEKVRQDKVGGTNASYADIVDKNLELTGKILQDILDRLYQEKISTVRIELIRDVSDALSGYPLGELASWNAHCAEILGDFGRIMGLEQILVFSNQSGESHLDMQMAMNSSTLGQCARKIPINNVREKISSNQLIEPDPSRPFERNLLNDLNARNRPVKLYFHVSDNMDQEFSTLLVFIGKTDNAKRRVLETFSETFCSRYAIASLFILLRMQNIAHARRVGIVAHSLRTPLQCVSLDLDWLTRNSGININPELNRRLLASQGRIFDAQEDIRALLDELNIKKKIWDFIPLACEVEKYLKPLADSHPCNLTRNGSWPATYTPVSIARYKIRIALINLVQNAIKYSYTGVRNQNRIHEVKIGIAIKRSGQTQYVEFSVSNYGVGIPPELISQYEQGLRPGERAEIPDSRFTREGTGWGLISAVETFKEHGGWIRIESKPGDDQSRSAREKYHRYVTTVRAYLPIQEEYYHVQ